MKVWKPSSKDYIREVIILKGHLEKRFHYLFTGESFAVIMFIFLSSLLNKVYPSLQLYSPSGKEKRQE